jgi:hypothetical protein
MGSQSPAPEAQNPTGSPGRVVELNPRVRNTRISYRPGARLERASQLFNEEVDHINAAVTMRKFREDVLMSLDAYCDTVLFDPGNLAASLAQYEALPPSHPLAGKAQKKICERLRHADVSRVLDPSAHSLTEVEVTRPNVKTCLGHLKEISAMLPKELDRLDALRLRSLRSTMIEVSTVSFSSLDSRAIWPDTVRFPLVGASAAKSNPWSVEFASAGEVVNLAPGGAIQVASDVMEPVARFGHWALLAEEGAQLNDGDLVAVHDQNDRRYLGRLWSNERKWIIQSINPNRPTPSLIKAKKLLGIRKIIGIVYSPLGSAKREEAEWLPCASVDICNVLKELRAIEVKGDSLEPIVRDGQKLLVDEPLVNLLACPDGELAVVEFADEDMGSVVKQVFPAKDRWTLVSANVVDRLPPITVLPTEIRALWVVRGVLFDTTTE